MDSSNALCHGRSNAVPLPMGALTSSSGTLSVTSSLQSSLMWAMHSLVDLTSHHQLFQTSPVIFSWGPFVLKGRPLWWDTSEMIRSGFHPKCPLVHKEKKSLKSLPYQRCEFHYSCSHPSLQPTHMKVSASSLLCPL